MKAPPGREPFLRQIGPKFKNDEGEEITPRAIFHPCFKEGCDANAPFGYGTNVRKNIGGTWSCAAHRQELEDLIRKQLQADQEVLAEGPDQPDLLYPPRTSSRRRPAPG